MSRKQPRRQSTRPTIVESDGDEEGTNVTATQSRNARMNDEIEEEFVKTCVKYFEQINDQSTFHGLPGTSAYKKRQATAAKTWEKIATEMNKFCKANNTVKYYKTKYKNTKTTAQKRSQLIAKQKKTGSGRLSKAEEKIVNSPAYADLALKLGVSAAGNVARGDSDAINANTQAPNARLRAAVNAESDDDATMITDNIDDADDIPTRDLEMSELSLSGEASHSADTSRDNEQSNLQIQRESTSQSANTHASTPDFELDSDTLDESTYANTTSTSSKSHTTKGQSKSRTARCGNMPRGDVSDDFLTRNLLKQEENHQIQREVLLIQKEKVQVSLEREQIELNQMKEVAELSLQREKLELEKAKYEFQSAKIRDNSKYKAEQELAAIELDKMKRLAQLEIAAKQKELDKLN